MLEGTIVGNSQEFGGKTTCCRRYIVEEGLLEGCKWQVELLENLQVWGRRDNSGRKVCISFRQYLRALKVLQNQGE
jgi:hypothetical protein